MTEPRRRHERIIGGLLGPSGTELACEECFDLLDVYVDSELAGENADERVPGMREHLIGCPACAEEHASLRDLVNASL
jgi:anti-sigma factor RsiW